MYYLSPLEVALELHISYNLKPNSGFACGFWPWAYTGSLVQLMLSWTMLWNNLKSYPAWTMQWRVIALSSIPCFYLVEGQNLICFDFWFHLFSSSDLIQLSPSYSKPVRDHDLYSSGRNVGTVVYCRSWLGTVQALLAVDEPSGGNSSPTNKVAVALFFC